MKQTPAVGRRRSAGRGERDQGIFLRPGGFRLPKLASTRCHRRALAVVLLLGGRWGLAAGVRAADTLWSQAKRSTPHVASHVVSAPRENPYACGVTRALAWLLPVSPAPQCG